MDKPIVVVGLTAGAAIRKSIPKPIIMEIRKPRSELRLYDLSVGICVHPVERLEETQCLAVRAFMDGGKEQI